MSTGTIEGKSFKRNIVVTISAHILSMLVGLLLSLVVPKFITIEQYAYWQTFILYIGFAGIFHFGLLDGLMLRYSQYDVDALNKKLIRSQFKWMLAILSTVSIIGIIVALSFTDSTNRNIILLLSLGIISKNLFTYNSYLLQLTNRIQNYAEVLICQRGVYAIIVVSLLLLKADRFEYFCIAELVGDFAACLYSRRYNKELYFGASVSLKESISDLKLNLIAGVFLMIANWSSVLVLGVSRMFVNWHWNSEIFGKVSLSFTLTHFVLSFIVPISVVLFPSLKRLDDERLQETYVNIRKKLMPPLMLSLVLYYPVSYLLRIWLPNYSDSLIYLAYLMPIIVSTTLISILTNNYLKAYRKERTLLYINLVSLAITAIITGIAAYVIDNLSVLLISTSLCMLFRSFLSETIISKIIGFKLTIHLVLECLVCIFFIASTYLPNIALSIISYLLMVVCLLYVEYKYPANKITS